jgi:hypothetical protein
MDRRVRRSRQALHEALVTLTLERGFADKEDALVGGLEHVRDDLHRRPHTAAFGSPATTS